MSTIELPELQLEEVCWHCHGSGQLNLITPKGQAARCTVPCEFCSGKGSQISTDGLKVLEFLARHWKPV